MGNESIGGAGGNGGQGGDGGDGGLSTGGDIVSFGNLSITSSTFLFGRALGGAGGSGVTGGDGGAGQGGSLYLLDTAYGFPPLAFTVTVTGSTVIGAVAEGGPGGSGGPSGTGGAGGLAQGGGIAVSLEGNGTFQVTVSESDLSANAAIGGDGGSGSVGGDGGDAEGGGLFVDPYSTVALDDDAIIGNLADGGSAPPTAPDRAVASTCPPQARRERTRRSRGTGRRAATTMFMAPSIDPSNGPVHATRCGERSGLAAPRFPAGGSETVTVLAIRPTRP